MGLIPTLYREFSRALADDEGASGYTEAVKSIFVRSGYFVDPGSGEEILLEQTRRVYNQLDVLIREDVETITVDMPGGPPRERLRVTKSTAWLPRVNHNRRLMEVERERTIYWPFTAFTSKDTLGATRQLDAWVVYTEAVNADPLPAGAVTKLEERGIDPGGDPGVVISTARLWSDVQADGANSQDPTSRQTARWVERVVFEEDVVEDEVDKVSIWTVTKNGLNPADVQVDGPRMVRKDGFSYRLPVAIDPPLTVIAATRIGFVQVLVKGGGAVITHSLIPRETVIQPQRYRIFRRTVSEPARSYSADRVGFWATPPAAPTGGGFLATSGAQTYAGGAASVLPTATSYDVPGDPTPSVDERWDELAEVVNANVASTLKNAGFAKYIDRDVENGGVYEYAASAVINDEESGLRVSSNVTYSGGATGRAYRISTRRNPATGALEADATAPDDPYYPEANYGEAVVYTIPALVGDALELAGNGYAVELAAGYDPDGTIIGYSQPGGGGGTGSPPEARAPGAELLTIQDLADAVAVRVFETERPERLLIDLTVLVPLIGLRRWMTVTTPAVSYDTHGGGITFTTSAEVTEWRLAGYTLTGTQTMLRLVER